MANVTTVELWCPHCGQRLLTPINQRGHQISCQGCGSIIVVPLNARIVTKHWSQNTPVLIGLIVLSIPVSVYLISSDSSEDTPERESLVDYSSASPKQFASASPEQKNHISSALGEKYTVHECRVIENRDQYEGYFIAARFSYEGIEKHEKVVGVWWIGGAKNKPTLLASINEPAYTHSRMGWASNSKRGYTMATPAATELYKALTK